MEKRLSFVLLLLFLFVFSGITKSQEVKKEVTGIVTDESGVPIIGASVVIDGTTVGVITDQFGKFSLKCSASNTLSISSLGYVAQKLKVEGRNSFVIKLKDEVSQLDEVIVVAYGTSKKSSYSGSASLVKQDALKDIPVTSFEGALSGKVAGLQISTNSSQAGAAPNIRIRGIGSMNASNEPLYVIDGVPVSSGNIGQMSDYIYATNNVMNSLNPEDIESISILKDAAASSLYGSRAANGVILITTKKGKEGKPSVTLKSSIGFTPSWATKNYETASTQEQVKMLYMVLHDYKTSDGATDAVANAYAIKQLNKKFNKYGYQFTTDNTSLDATVNIEDYDNSGRAGHYFDWDKALFRTAMYQTYDLAVSGASPTTNYYTTRWRN